jgi:hypothetical protein
MHAAPELTGLERGLDREAQLRAMPALAIGDGPLDARIGPIGKGRADVESPDPRDGYDGIRFRATFQPVNLRRG